MHDAIILGGPPDQLDKTQWLRSATPSIRVARPYDPAPLMDALRVRSTHGRWRFAAFGDTHHSPAFDQIARLVREMRLDFVMSLGDLVNLGGGREGQANYTRLENASGEFLRALPVWAATGNHDLDSRWDNDIWNGISNFKVFYNPEPHYSFDFRNARFIVLSWMLPDEAELAWCEQQLQNACHPFVFVVLHYPLFGFDLAALPEVQAQRELALHRLLSRYRVTAMLSGHTHVYYRALRDSVTYLVSGGAGVNTHELSRRPRADDTWYARERETGDYVCRTPARERRWKAMQNFFLVFDVDEAETRVEVLSTSGETWEQFRLSPRPRDSAE